MTFPLQHAPTARTVLYVEDCEVNAAIMKTLFDFHADWRLVIATDGRQALDLAGRLCPDLLLLDIQLPDCRGDDLLSRLQGLAGVGSVPAIAVTAERDFSIHGTGFDDVWQKPLDLQRVTARLNHWLPHQPSAGPLGRAAATHRATAAAAGLIGRRQRGRPSTIVQ